MCKPAVRIVIFIALPFVCGPLGALETGDLDGQWCSRDGKTISVAGTAIIAANGLRATGVYTEKALAFIEPRQDGQEGPKIWIEPKGKNTVRVSIVSAVQKEPPPHDLWTRCRITS